MDAATPSIDRPDSVLPQGEKYIYIKLTCGGFDPSLIKNGGHIWVIVTVMVNFQML